MGVSSATLREAMRAFEGQGLISRRQGVGTFVVRNQQIIESGVEILESIESIAARMGLQVSMGMLNIEHLDADLDQANMFAGQSGTPLVRLTRVINAEERPVAFLIDLLPVEILPDNGLKEGFTGSVLDWLLKRGTPQLDHSITEIQAVAAPSEIARALQIQRGDVLLEICCQVIYRRRGIGGSFLQLFPAGLFPLSRGAAGEGSEITSFQSKLQNPNQKHSKKECEMRSFSGRDILSLKDFERQEFFHVFEVADEMEPIAKSRRNSDLLAEKTLVTAFYQPSTRTRLAHEAAMHRLGGHVTGFSDAKMTRAGDWYQESIKDTVKMLEFYGDVIVMRHFQQGAPQKLPNGLVYRSSMAVMAGASTPPRS